MFFLFVLIIVFVLAIAIHTSKIGIGIENFKIDTEKPSGEKINKDYKIYLYFIIFKKLKIFKKNLKKINLKNIKIESKNIDIKILKNKDFKINYLELIKNVKIETKQIDLQIQVGTEDAALTAIVTGIISSILGIILKKPKYEVNPIYNNKNIFKIKLEGIFTIYMMHYIYIQIFKIKRRVDKNERTPNRKSYDDCYE